MVWGLGFRRVQGLGIREGFIRAFRLSGGLGIRGLGWPQKSSPLMLRHNCLQRPNELPTCSWEGASAPSETWSSSSIPREHKRRARAYILGFRV